MSNSVIRHPDPILDALLTLQAAVDAGTAQAQGICSPVKSYIYHYRNGSFGAHKRAGEWLHAAFEAWPEVAWVDGYKSLYYPVAHPGYRPEVAFFKFAHWHTGTEYGRNRRALLTFLIERRTSEIANK